MRRWTPALRRPGDEHGSGCAGVASRFSPGAQADSKRRHSRMFAWPCGERRWHADIL